MASVYWATFPSSYLDKVRHEPFTQLKRWKPKVQLNHTKRYTLYIAEERTEFIKHTVALFRFVAAGEANIGHVRKDATEIHRKGDIDEPVEYPPQRAIDEEDEKRFIEEQGFMLFAS